ncbi:MAG: hypothetical protein ABFD50_02775 [Smithella sp.]
MPKNEILKIRKLKTTIYENFKNPANEYDKVAAIYIGTIIGENFEAKEIEEEFRNHSRLFFMKSRRSSSLFEFAKFLNINLEEKQQEEPLLRSA